MPDPAPDAAPDDRVPEGYAEALAELDRLLQRLEGGGADVDRVVADVARASYLLSWCRDRLADASLEIERVTATLDATRDDATPDGPTLDDER